MPASNLNQNAGGIAAGYGIGAGLSGFADAYMNALNYQLAKRKAASESNYQDAMAQAAMKNAGTESDYKRGMLDVENQKIPISQAEANAKFLEMGGTPVADYYGFKPTAVSQAEQNPSQSSQVQAPPPVPQVPSAPEPGSLEQGPGFIGPPRPQGLLPQQSQFSAQIQGPTQSSPQGGLVKPNVTPFWQRKMQMEQMLASQKEANDLKIKNATEGNGIQTAIDPATGRPTVTGRGPLSGPALQAFQKNQAETAAAQDLPTQRLTETFQADKGVQNANEVASNFNQLKRGYNSKSPTAQEDMFFSLMKLASPGQAVREAPLEDLQKLPMWNQHFEDLYNKAFSGTVSQRTKDDLMRAGSELASGNAENYKDIQSRYTQMARDRGATPSFIKNPIIEKSGGEANDMLGKLGPYQPPTAGWLQNAGNKVRGLLFSNEPGKQDGSQGPHGNSVIQNGHTYTWNPQTKAYE